MSVQTVARRYANALADVVIARGEARDVQQELIGWERMMLDNPDLHEVFRNPTIAYDRKRAVLAKLIERTRVRPTTANFLNVLLQNQRIADLVEVNKKLEHVLDERAGVVSASVTSARPVPDDSRRALESKLAEITRKKVRLEFGLDQELIGGIVTRIGSTVYDGSIRTQLQQAKHRLSGKQ